VRLERGLALAALATAGAFVVSSGAAAAASADAVAPASSVLASQENCSRATALRVGKPYFWDTKYTISQLLCGQFTGPGSNAMVIVFTAPTCWPLQGWAVFRFLDGDWRLVLLKRGVFVYPLAAVGRDIRETAPVYRRGDARCTPSGGRRARTWRWSGAGLVAGPWKQTQRPEAPPPARVPKIGHFKTPSGNIVCLHSPGPADRPVARVVCGIKSGLKPKPPYTARCRQLGLDHTADRINLEATGRALPSPCSGDAGPLLGERDARVLGYGKAWSGGGITCRSAFTGLTCRNRSGHGFFLSRARWRRF
jgi:hypothetical protein